MDEFIEDSAGYLEEQAGDYDTERDYSEEEYNQQTLECPGDLWDYEAGISENWGY